MHDLLDPWKNPITFAIPFFLISIALELAALKWLPQDEKTTGYQPRDATTSILMGLGSLVSTLVMKVIGFLVYIWIYDHLAPFHLPHSGLRDTWWSWVLVVVGVDFLFYWEHRFVHRARVGWAAHQAHHSSQYMNFATALRQKWNPWWEVVFWLPLPFLGVHPGQLFFAWSLNLIYQFFTHTETIGKLWRPIELVMNTPSHHRVHHGSDLEYLDKNYAGILIVWDRLFGTFQPELQRPTYGLTKNKSTYNPISLQYGDYADLWHDVRGARGWRTKLGYLFNPPYWEPEPNPGQGRAS